MKSTESRTAAVDWRSHTIGLTVFTAGPGAAAAASAGLPFAAGGIGLAGALVIAAAAFGGGLRTGKETNRTGV